MHVLCNFDATLISSSDVLTITGWVVSLSHKIVFLFARVGDDPPVRCQFGTLRPDVIAALRLPSSAIGSGLDVAIPLNGRTGVIQVTFLAEAADGRRLEVCKRRIALEELKETPFPYHLDSLRPDRTNDVLTLSGWVVHPREKIVSTAGVIEDDPPVRFRHGIPRPDVIAAYNFPSISLNSGFEGQLPLNGRTGSVGVRFLAELPDGREREFCSRVVVLDNTGGAAAPALELGKLAQFPQEAPIFIVGMSRSGTSAMTSALLDGAKLPGYREGHLFGVLEPILDAILSVWTREMSTLGLTTFSSRLACENYDIYAALNQVIQTFHNTYHERLSSRTWVDKTPDKKGIKAITLLRHLYPNARFIFMYRHPIKAALSRKRKFPKIHLSTSFLDWAHCLEDWQEAKVKLCPGTFAEIAQEDLAQKTRSVTAALRQLLHLRDDQADGVSRILATARPQFTGSSSDSEELCVEDMDWTETEKESLMSICSKGARELGYKITRG
jgi:hypothetical protein